MTAPSISVLGPIVLSVDGTEVPLPAKVRVVLAILALNAGRTVTVDQLLDSLWGESVTAGATNTLQSYVSRLRTVTHDVGFVQRRGPGYVLDIRPDQVDALQFEALVTEARAHSGDPERVVRALQPALRLWRGKPLADADGEPFAQGPVTRLEELRAEAWERLHDAELALGNHVAVIGRLEELTAEHPLRERFAAQLAVAQYRAGRQADALQTIGRIRERLLEDLGLSMGDDLVELERLILNQDATLAPPQPAPPARAAELPHPAASSLAHPLVGRDQELKRLVTAWRGAVGGRPALVVVSGEPGVGKTRLVAELAALVHNEGRRVAWGRCTEQSHLPYEPFVEAVGAVRDPRRPAAAFTEALHEKAFADPEIGLLALHETVAGALGDALSAGGLVVLDDLQWGDAKSVSMFAHVAGSLLSSGVLMVIGRRSGVANLQLDRALADLRRSHVVERIDLAGLGASAVAELVAGVRGDGAELADLASRLHDWTSGNPFFIHEMLAADGELEPTATVAEAVALRLGPPDQPLGRLLSAAAVLERDADLSVLAEVARLEEDEALAAVDAALAGDLLRESTEGGEDLSFSHSIVRDVAYQMMTGARRRTLHRRAAAAIGSRHPLEAPGPHQVVIAQHLLAAGSGVGEGELMEAAAAASEWCLRVLAYDDAITFAEQALSRAGQIVDEDDEAGVRDEAVVRLQLAHALNATGRPGEAREHLQKVMASSRRLHTSTGSPEDARLVAAAALGMAGGPGAGVGVRWGVIDHELAWALKSALDVVGPADLRSRARLLSALAQAVYNDPEAAGVRDESSAAAVEIAEQLGDATLLGTALIARCIARWGPDGLDERLELAKRAAGIAARENDDAMAIAASLRLLPDAFEAADLDAVRASLAVLDEKTARLKQPRFRWFPP